MGVTDIKTTGEFDKIINENNKVVVFFVVTYIGTCRAIAPIIDKYSNEDEFKDEIKFIEVNAEFLEDVATRLGLRTFPTFMFFKNGQMVGQLVGADPDALLSFLRKNND